MARLWSSGFEQNSLSTEFWANTGSPIIQTGIVRSGTYAAKYAVTGGFNSYHQMRFNGVSTPTNKKAYIRAYAYTTSYPTVINNSLLKIFSYNGSNQLLAVRVKTDGTLILFDLVNSAQVGSASVALPLSSWNRIELSLDFTTITATVVTVYLNGTQFATGTVNWSNAASFEPGFLQWGMELASSSTWAVYFDDLAVNDNGGLSQNSLPGEGSIIHLKPNAAGDVNTFATQTGGTAGSSNNFTRVDEVTPDDATSFNGSSTLNQQDLFNVSDSGIGASDTVNVVSVGARLRNNVVDATTAIKLEIEKTTGGTIAQSAAIIANTTTWANNNPSFSNNNYALSTYQDPDGAAWTQSTLDTMQIGYKLTTGGTNRIDVSSVWALVDYTPAPIGIGVIRPTAIKPRLPVLNRNSRFRNGLVAALALSEQGGGVTTNYKDLASSLVGVSSGIITPSTDIYGAMAKFNGEATGGGIIQYLTAKNQQDQTKFSWLFLYSRHATGGGNTSPKYFMLVDSGSGTAGKYLSEDSGTAMQIDILWSGGDALWDYAFPAVDQVVIDIITYDGSSTSNNPSVYRNGLPLSVTTVAAPLGTIQTGDDTTLALGNHPAQSRTMNGKIGMFCMWNRILSSSEIVTLSANPWKLFKEPGFYQSLNSISGTHYYSFLPTLGIG